MTTAVPSTALATIQPAFTDTERLALAGYLAGYRGLTGEAYTLAAPRGALLYSRFGSGLCPWEVPVRYQFRVRGRLSKTLLGAFPELRVEVLRSETLLAGQLPDQAALFGVLDRIEALGLELLEVLRTEDH